MVIPSKNLREMVTNRGVNNILNWGEHNDVHWFLQTVNSNIGEFSLNLASFMAAVNRTRTRLLLNAVEVIKVFTFPPTNCACFRWNSSRHFTSMCQNASTTYGNQCVFQSNFHNVRFFTFKVNTYTLVSLWTIATEYILERLI